MKLNSLSLFTLTKNEIVMRVVYSKKNREDYLYMPNLKRRSIIALLFLNESTHSLITMIFRKSP